ncbi:MAG: mandelate racemase/muconate lactonizing enzyme family protein, partial [Betaproteobacteria bacterium AqS2]|nr:mandelate racemase/muconate lactonizing enzyme family protein [Betaproteobacteria bacterium AqS2]
HDLPEELGYSQQYYAKRTAHLVEVSTDEGVTGWGECFGPGPVALANKAIVEQVVAPMVVGTDPLDRERTWHKAYNLLRDHGQKGMSMQALSGVDIALWDIVGKSTGLPIAQLAGGLCRDEVPVYGYGMMLRRLPAKELAAAFKDEAAAIKEAGFAAVKMKVGLGARDDIRLAEAARAGLGDDCPLMVDANHCYDTPTAFTVGRELARLNVHWFEEPVAPEDRDGYRELRAGLELNIAGGEAQFGRWGWRRLLEARCIDIAQPEACALGGISEYLKVLALAHANFIPVVNHVWGSAVAVAVNLQLLGHMADLPGGLHPVEPLLEFDTTLNLFRDELPTEPLDIQGQVAATGRARVPAKPGHGVEPRPDLLDKYRIA